MEQRRLFTAIILSLLVLITYDNLVVSPNRKNKTANKPPISQTKNDSAVTEPSVVNAKQELVPPPLSFDENLIPLTTKEIKASFSNRGGVLADIFFEGSDQHFPVNSLISVPDFASSKFEVIDNNNKSPIFSILSNGLKIEKKYVILDENNVQAKVRILNQSNSSKLIDLKISAVELLNRLDNKNQTEHSLFEYSIYSKNKTYRKNYPSKFSSKDNLSESKAIEWVGVRNRYYCAIIKPEFITKGFETYAVDDKSLIINIIPDNVTLDPQKEITYTFSIYLGPQELGKLTAYKQNFEKIMVFSNWGWLDAIAKAIYHALLFLHKIIPNWGLCIILVGFLVYGLTYPLTLQSMSSMRKLQEIQPKINELKEKYKSDPQKLQAEQLELYKKYQINPLGGCLPLVIQMPILYDLYQVFWRSHFFKGASFLWIKDLSGPDKFYILPIQLPFIGNELNLLPIIMTIVMAFQQKLSTKNMVVTDPAQLAQQKMMSIMMPFFIGFIFYHFSSAWTLYFTVFYSLSLFTQMKMSKINVRIV